MIVVSRHLLVITILLCQLFGCNINPDLIRKMYSKQLRISYFLLTHICLWIHVLGSFEYRDGFKIGAFNIRIFGASKANKPEVMDILGKIIRRYDIVLVQEIRDVKGTAITDLLREINKARTPSHYSMLLSDRLGRTSSKEQYAFFYRDNSDISVVSSYHYDDGDESLGKDTFEREPFIVRFKVKGTVVSDIVLAGIHVKPSNAVAEIKALKDVHNNIRRKWHAPNIIFLGDMNAGCSYVPKYAWANIDIRNEKKFHWPIDNDVDTTVSNKTHCAYDRFILYGSTLIDAVYPGSASVFHFDKIYRLSSDEALQVSDHYPIELELKHTLDFLGTSTSRRLHQISGMMYASFAFARLL